MVPITAVPVRRAKHRTYASRKADRIIKMTDAESTEVVLARLPSNGLAHIYKLPPRPDARGWNCQAWPKENHIFAAKVHICAKARMLN